MAVTVLWRWSFWWILHVILPQLLQLPAWRFPRLSQIWRRGMKLGQVRTQSWPFWDPDVFLESILLGLFASLELISRVPKKWIFSFCQHSSLMVEISGSHKFYNGSFSTCFLISWASRVSQVTGNFRPVGRPHLCPLLWTTYRNSPENEVL